MAYLTTFRKHGVGPRNWSAIEAERHDPNMDRLLDEADACLNSWEEAHKVFNLWQADQPKVDGNAFVLMKPLVHKAIGEQLCNTFTSYPNEAITYALLERWIEARQDQLKIDREKGHAPR